jgi:hypothetical protein
VPKWLIPWLFPLGLLLVVVAIAASTILAVGLAVVAGLVGVPLVYHAYQANRASHAGDEAKPRRADPPNNRSLLR